MVRSGFFDSRTGLAVAALVLLVAGGGALSLFVDRWNAPKEMRNAEQCQCARSGCSGAGGGVDGESTASGTAAR